MELNYTLQREDYITLNLYHTSKNSHVKQQRIRSWIIMAVAFTFITFFLYGRMSIELAFFVPLFVTSLILYPFFISYWYKRNIKRSVRANYGNAYSDQISVTIGDEYIESRYPKGLARINTPYIDGFVEIGDCFFIRLSGLSYIIIPKRHYQDVDFIRKKMMDISNRYNLPFDVELDWKWK